VTVECTLEELYFGCKKDIHFNRKTLNAANADKVIEASRSIEVKPGMGLSPLKFHGEGHIRFGQK
jgi:DnaJ-class molecular chaperone